MNGYPPCRSPLPSPALHTHLHGGMRLAAVLAAQTRGHRVLEGAPDEDATGGVARGNERVIRRDGQTLREMGAREVGSSGGWEIG